MNLIKYRAFIKVIELGSITKAAKTLGYSQPGISHMLDSMEAEVGFPLLIRTRDAITPTDDGKKILYYCRQIIKNEDAMQDMISSVNGLLSGSIKVGAYNSMLLFHIPHLVSEFTKVYSNIEISLEERAYSEMQQGLLNGSIDVAFMSSDRPKGYEFYPLFSVPIGLIMHSKHPLASYDKIPIRTLNGCDFIMPSVGWDDVYNMVQKKKSFTPNIKHYVASDTAVVAMVADNLGVYILPKLFATNLPENVVFREFEENVQREYGICLKSLKHANPALKEFVKMAMQNLANDGTK